MLLRLGRSGALPLSEQSKLPNATRTNIHAARLRLPANQ